MIKNWQNISHQNLCIEIESNISHQNLCIEIESNIKT